MVGSETSVPGLPWDTIIAPATPPGEGGVSIIRISGVRASELLQRWFIPRRPGCRWASHRLYYGEIRHPQTGDSVDEALAVLMRGPRSYTGEDVAELHCHGSPEVVRAVLDLARSEGVRLALPGELTQRAVLNGRMDLAQAEAVLETITAKSERALKQARSGAAGVLSGAVETVRQRIVHAQAYVEASIDFAEDEIPDEDLHGPLTEALEKITSLIARARHGLVYRSGVRVTLLGRPNVGKSSLLNAILRSPRAIVTDVPGTTRDTVEESVVIRGIPMVVTDTAGVRETDDPVERLGVARSVEAAEAATIRIIVLDASEPLTESDLTLLRDYAQEQALIVLNKSDLTLRIDVRIVSALVRSATQLCVSALNSEGLEALEAVLEQMAIASAGVFSGEELLMAIPRHLEALERAQEALGRALTSLERSQPHELAAGELAIAARALGEITGVNATEDLLDTIFSRFCLGK